MNGDRGTMRSGPAGAGGGTSQRPGGWGGGQRGGGMFGGGPMGGLGMSGKKAKNFWGTLFRLLGYFKPQWFWLLVVLVAAIISTVFNVVGPKILALALNKLADGVVAKFFRHIPGATIDFTYIGDVLLIMLGLYVVSSLFSYVQQYTMAGVAQKTVYGLRREVEEKLGRLP